MVKQANGDSVREVDFLPWVYDPQSEEGRRQDERQAELAQTGATFGESVFVAPNAAVYCDQLSVGDRTYIAALAYLTGDLTLGADCSVNPFAVIRGQITMGDGVRIGAHTSILGFNHFMATDAPVFTQGIFSKGITIGDDVWVGSNATILDGVTVGSHVVIAAGAIVTKDVADWAIVAGNPAKQIRDRRAERKPARPHNTSDSDVSSGSSGSSKSDGSDIERRLASFARALPEQAGDILARCFEDGRFVDRPAALAGALTPAIRPWSDAIEIAHNLLGDVPPGFTAENLAFRLNALQDPQTGLVPAGDISDRGLEQPRSQGEPLSPFDRTESYHILSIGYALKLLGSTFNHPISAAYSLSDHALVRALESRDWGAEAWASGSAVDTISTAIAFNMRDFADRFADGGVGPLYGLMGWLTARANPSTGLWGAPQPPKQGKWLQAANGFYRLTRGSYAQFGIPLPYPEATISTLLEHARDPLLDSGSGYTACNILDIIHPLWLASKQTAHRRTEGEAWARLQLERALTHWVDGAGFAFAPDAHDSDAVVGLQGTEMWLSIVWLLADYLGMSDALGYRPEGVHNPDPLITLNPIDRP
jgi:acetyltransferase-like isoleucine patch superfamily enzyme